MRPNELSGQQRQAMRPELAKMYRVQPDRASWPSVGAPLERGNRQHVVPSATGREPLHALEVEHRAPSPHERDRALDLHIHCLDTLASPSTELVRLSVYVGSNAVGRSKDTCGALLGNHECSLVRRNDASRRAASKSCRNGQDERGEPHVVFQLLPRMRHGLRHCGRSPHSHQDDREALWHNNER